jgi:hypothetical protein
LDHQEIWRLYQTRLWKVVQLAERFHVSRPTIYDVLKRARLQEFTPRKVLTSGLKHCSTVSSAWPRSNKPPQEHLKREAKRYNKSYPGELVHFDTKRPSLLKG